MPTAVRAAGDRGLALSRHDADACLRGVLRIARAAAADAFISERLAAAETSFQVHVTDVEAPELTFTILLDRCPIEVHEGAFGTPEVHIHTTLADCVRLFTGNEDLAIAIARGDVTYTGPIRKVLRIVPIFRRLAGEPARDLFVGEPEDATAHGLLERLLAPVASAAVGDESSPVIVEDEPAALLEQAADYAEQHGDLHEGALLFDEPEPGEFWSIRIEGVHKTFGNNQVLNGLELGIPEGMISLILGPSGTGKSVLINHLIGLMFPDAGEVVVHGESLNEMTHSRMLEMRKKFGILFQDGALFGSMNVFDNVAFPLREHTDLSEAEVAATVNARLAEVGLSAAADRMPAELSGGMRKRAGFARALVLEPEIVIFDEPDSGLDPVRTALLCELIQKMHQEHGGTYIVITHDIASARQLGEYIAVLWKGRIVQSGSAAEMFASRNPFVRQFLNRATAGPLGME